MNTIQTLKEIKGQAITLDFNKNNYISVTAKQYDENSRNIFIKVSNSGQILKLDKSLMVEIKMKTPNGRDILDISTVQILDDGVILFNPSDDMLTQSGKSLVELRIYDLESVGRISTMNFYMVIIASPYEEDGILESKEFKSLVDLYSKVVKDYTYIIDECQTYASLASESEQNATQSALSANADATIATTKAEEALQSATTATTKATEAFVSAEKALLSEQNSKVSEDNSKASETASKLSETNARESEVNAELYMNTAIEKADGAMESEIISITKADEANTSAINAALSEQHAKESETVATTMVDLSKSYAIGTNDFVRPGDTTDNSKYYYELAKTHALASGGIIYMGNKTFAELSLEENQVTNYLFNISEEFVSDDTFKDGAGVRYSMGTNVCRTADGYWDVFCGIESFTTGEIITETIEKEPIDQREGAYWVFEY